MFDGARDWTGSTIAVGGSLESRSVMSQKAISARSAAVMGGQRGSDGVVSGDTDLGDLRQVIEGLTGASLDGHTEPVEGPGWPQPRSYPVRECLLCILNEEWEHRLYAERDLDALEARSA